MPKPAPQPKGTMRLALDGGRVTPHPYACQSAGRPLRQSRKAAGEESPGSTDERCRITSGGGDPRESATEKQTAARLRKADGKGETVR